MAQEMGRGREDVGDVKSVQALVTTLKRAKKTGWR